MKKIFISLLILIASVNCFAQPSPSETIFQGTMVPGSASNLVKVVAKATFPGTFSGSFSNVYITLQIPTSVGPRPVITLKTNYLAANIPAYLPPILTTENNFYTYAFSAFPVAAAPYTFTSGAEIPMADFEISGGSGTSTVRLAHLADGGATGNAAFYIEVQGNNNTNYANLFYGSGATNGGSVSANSFLPVANIALPLRITDFKASRSNDNGLLNWTVENQSADNSHFEVERSLTGLSFEKVGQVDVAANSNIYNFTDLNIVSLQHKGVVYYRLKQVDLDGKFVYSATKSIRIDKSKVAISLYPNPASVTSTLMIDLPEAAAINVVVSDANGKQIDTYELQGVKGMNQKHIDVSKYAAGSYMFRIKAGEETQTLSLVKTK